MAYGASKQLIREKARRWPQHLPPDKIIIKTGLFGEGDEIFPGIEPRDLLFEERGWLYGPIEQTTYTSDTKVIVGATYLSTPHATLKNMTGTNFLARLQRARFLYIPLGELTTRKEERNLVVENPSTEYEEENRIIEDIKNYRMFKLLGARLRNRTEYASKQLEDNARQVLEAIAKQWKP